MTTMGGGSLTFSREGDAISVSRDGTNSATFASEGTEAGNGVVIPIDAALIPQGATNAGASDETGAAAQ